MVFPRRTVHAISDCCEDVEKSIGTVGGRGGRGEKGARAPNERFKRARARERIYASIPAIKLRRLGAATHAISKYAICMSRVRASERITPFRSSTVCRVLPLPSFSLFLAGRGSIVFIRSFVSPSPPSLPRDDDARNALAIPPRTRTSLRRRPALLPSPL